MSLKLTDIMFNLEYIAANCGADIENKGDVFYTEELVAAGNLLTLTHQPVPVISGGHTYVWYREAAAGGDDMARIEVTGKSFTVPVENGTYCVMYRYTDDAAKQIVINSQFIPATLHAVLTVALYSGDSCNIEASNKVGEVEIDIPRFQLTGAMDITMSAVRLVA